MSIKFDQEPPKRPVQRVVGLRRYAEVVTNKEGMEITRCDTMAEACAIAQTAVIKGATKISIFILTEKIKQPND